MCYSVLGGSEGCIDWCKEECVFVIYKVTRWGEVGCVTVCGGDV